MTSKEKTLMTKSHKQDPRGHHGTDATPDRGRTYGTKIQSTDMAGTESGNRFGIRSGKVGDIKDSINAGKRK